MTTDNQEAHNINLDHVRRVLMNDLGLSRESVREVMRTVVIDACEKYVKAGALDKVLEKEIQNQIKTNYTASSKFSSPPTLKAIITDAVGEAVKKQITSHIASIAESVARTVKIQITEEIIANLPKED